MVSSSSLLHYLAGPSAGEGKVQVDHLSYIFSTSGSINIRILILSAVVDFPYHIDPFDHVLVALAWNYLFG